MWEGSINFPFKKERETTLFLQICSVLNTVSAACCCLVLGVRSDRDAACRVVSCVMHLALLFFFLSFEARCGWGEEAARPLKNAFLACCGVAEGLTAIFFFCALFPDDVCSGCEGLLCC